jgi:CheY-like chemotaxis protein
MLKTKKLFAPDDGVTPRGQSETEVTRRVLLVEPDEAFAGVLDRWLQGQKYHVTQARNAGEAALCASHAEFDYVLCEMDLPDQPGEQVYAALQRTHPHLCGSFIFTCGPRGAARMEAFLAKTRALVLWKPFEVQTTQEAFAVADRRQRASSVL